MERFTISLESNLASAFDRLIARRGYRNRSEAVRDLLRAEMERSHAEDEEKEQEKEQGSYCVATLSYVYNHHERELSRRVTGLQHDHHDLCVSTLHAHLDHDNCVECTILRGPTLAVRQFAEKVMAQPGVRHGNLKLVTVDVAAGGTPHGRGLAHPAQPQHFHYLPRS